MWLFSGYYDFEMIIVGLMKYFTSHVRGSNNGDYKGWLRCCINLNRIKSFRNQRIFMENKMQLLISVVVLSDDRSIFTDSLPVVS